MLLLRNKMINLPVISITTGTKLGRVIDFLIDSTSFKVAVIRIKSQLIKKYLLPGDIRNWDSTKILINGPENFSEKSDLIRLQNLIDDNFNLIGTKVETISKEKLGKVEDFSFDFIDSNIYKIYVKPKNIFKNFLKTHLVIGREDIIEVRKDKIIVRDAISRSPVRAKAVLPAQNT